MQIRPINCFADDPTTVTLLDAEVIPYAAITFDPGTYRFSYSPSGGGNQVDITTLLSSTDKLTFPGYNPTTAGDLTAQQMAQTQAQLIQATVATSQVASNTNDIKLALYAIGGIALLYLVLNRK